MLNVRNRVSRIPVLLGVCLTLCLCASVRAANPKVTLKLQDVTASEAVAALAKASGVMLLFEDRSSPAGQRASFDWSDVPLSRAMRDLSDKLHMGFSHFGIRRGYYAHVSTNLRAPAVSGIATERNGVRVSLNALSANLERDENFTDPQRRHGSAGVNLQFSVLFPGGDAEAISGISNLTAKDDLGNVLVSTGRSAAADSSYTGFPDETNVQAYLSGYDFRAHKLLWIEGQVERYKVFHDDVVDFPLPLSAGAIHKEADGLAVDVTKLDLPEPGVRGAAAAELQVVTPAQERLEWPRLQDDRPDIFLVGRSGRLFFPNTNQGAIQQLHGPTTVTKVTCTWLSLPEDVVALQVTWREKRDPEPLVAFRLSDIPLPQEGAFVPHHQDSGLHAFFDPAGGTLSGAVRLAGAPLVTGDVWYGLSPVDPNQESLTRWREVHLLPDGTGKLEKVKPGKYRVLRIYRTDGPSLLTDTGHWLHTEETIEIRAGEKASLPPLEWTPEAAAPVQPAK